MSDSRIAEGFALPASFEVLNGLRPLLGNRDIWPVFAMVNSSVRAAIEAAIKAARESTLTQEE